MSVDLILFIFFFGIVGIGGYWLWRRKAAAGKPKPKQDAKAKRESRPAVMAVPFLGKIEEEMFKRMYAALPDLHIFAKVQIGKLLALENPQPDTDTSGFDRLARRTVDFAIYDQELKLVCVVGLAKGESDSESGKLREYYFKKAGIKCINWNPEAMPTADQIARYVLPLVASGPGKAGAAKKVETDTVLQMYREHPEPAATAARGYLTVPMLDKLTPDKVLLNTYPHVWQRICVFAPEPKYLQKYLQSLSVNDRREERAGFSAEALREITAIQSENQQFVAKPLSPWQRDILNP